MLPFDRSIKVLFAISDPILSNPITRGVQTRSQPIFYIWCFVRNVHPIKVVTKLSLFILDISAVSIHFHVGNIQLLSYNLISRLYWAISVSQTKTYMPLTYLICALPPPLRQISNEKYSKTVQDEVNMNSLRKDSTTPFFAYRISLCASLSIPLDINKFSFCCEMKMPQTPKKCFTY